MHNIQTSSSYKLSPSRRQTLTLPAPVPWPSIMRDLIKINSVLDSYNQDPQNNQVRATFIQTVNQVLQTNAIIRNYFEARKEFSYFFAKIFKANPSSWGKSNSYVAERFAIISQILIDKYQINSFIVQHRQFTSASPLQLPKVPKAQLSIDYTEACEAEFQSRFFQLNKRNLPLKIFNKQANHDRAFGLRLRSDVSIRKQIQMLAKYNLATVQHAHISLRILPGSIPLQPGPLGEWLKSKLFNVTNLTFEVNTIMLDHQRPRGINDQLNQLMTSFWQLLKQHKHITTLNLDLYKTFTIREQQLKIVANTLKYLKNLTNLNLKMKEGEDISNIEVTYFLRNLHGLTKLSTLNFKRLEGWLSDYLYPNIMDPILTNLSALTNLTQLVINLKQKDITSGQLVRLSKVILSLPKLSRLAIHLEAFQPELDNNYTGQELSLFIRNLNLATSLTTFRLIMPENVNAAIILINALLDLDNSIKLELQLKHDVNLIKLIATAIHKLGPTARSLKNLAKLDLILGHQQLSQADELPELQGKNLAHTYFSDLQLSLKHCNPLPTLKLDLYRNNKLSCYLLKALEALEHLEELELVVSCYYKTLTAEEEFLTTLSQTVNNLKALSTLKLTFDYIENYDDEFAYTLSPPPRIRPFISLITSLTRFARFKLAIYNLGENSLKHLENGFMNHINMINTKHSQFRSCYVLQVSPTYRRRSANQFSKHEDRILKVYF